MSSAIGVLDTKIWQLYRNRHMIIRRSFQCQDMTAELLYNSSKFRTEMYDVRMPVVRRGSSFDIICGKFETDAINEDSIGVTVHANSVDKLIELPLTKGTPNKGFSFDSRVDRNKRIIATVNVDITAAAGLHFISLTFNGKQIKEELAFYVVFNPFDRADKVWAWDNAPYIREYLLSTRAKVYCGSAHSHFAKTYELDQFSIECIMVCAHFMDRMHYKIRNNPTLVARELSALLNGNDDRGLLWGNWNKVTDGTPPTAWVNAKQIYSEYLTTGQPVKWAQCFIYCYNLVSACRHLGYLSKPVSGFGIAHDNDNNGIITMIYDARTMERMSGSEMIWNYHAFVQVVINRDEDLLLELAGKATIDRWWNHLDATPQTIDGRCVCGPFLIDLLRRNMFEDEIPYDGKPTFYSINYKVKSVRVKDGIEKTEYISDQSCELIVSTDENGKKVDVTHQYKPVKSTEDSVEDLLNAKLTIDAPAEVHLHQDIPFKIRVENLVAGRTTRLHYTLCLKNIDGINMLGHHKIVSKTAIFTDERFEVEDILSPIDITEELRRVDLSMCLLSWEAQCYNAATKLVKTATWDSRILPCFEGSIKAPFATYAKSYTDISVKVTNTLGIDVSKCTVKVGIKGTRDQYSHTVEEIKANSTEKLTFQIRIRNSGYQTLEAYILSPVYNGKIAKQRISVY